MSKRMALAAFALALACTDGSIAQPSDGHGWSGLGVTAAGFAWRATAGWLDVSVTAISAPITIASHRFIVAALRLRVPVVRLCRLP